jgi:signal transduction histidine kinase
MQAGALVERIHAAQLAVGQAASQIETLADFSALMSRVAAELVGGSAAAFWRLHPGGTSASILPGAYGLPAEAVSGSELPCDPATESHGACVVSGDEILRVPAGTASAFLPSPLPRTGVLAVPWRIGDRRLGALCAYGPRRRAGFTEEDGYVLRAMANSIANVYNRQEVLERLREELAGRERAERRLNQMLHMAELLNSILDPYQLLDTLLLQAMDLVGADAGWAGFRAPEGLAVERYTLKGDFVPFEYTWPPGHGAAGWTLLHKIPYLTNHPTEDAQIDQDLRDRFGIARLLCVPIVDAQGEVLGFFELHNKGSDFDEDDRELLSALASHTALTLQNAIAYDRLGQLEQAKSDFLNLAAHELRGPVATARGYLTLLEDAAGWSQAQRAQMVDTITKKLDHIRFLVDQMLTAARLEDHRLPLEEQEFDLGQVLEETARELGFAIKAQHHLTIEASSPAPVKGDRRRVGAILANLIDNAFKYSPDGGEVRVTCSTRAGWAEVLVEDHGIGIAEEDLPRLFRRFGRIVTSTNSHIPGTGLGLYLSRQLALLHGGDITVKSEPGVGSSFLLRLPLAS